MKVAITGSISAGKSTISEYLRCSGYTVIDTDKLSHTLIQSNSICYNEIVEYFGNSILSCNKEIDRKKLGNIIFNDDDKRKKLESIIHPYIIKSVVECSNEKLIFFEVPLLYEAKMESLFFKTIVVYCDDKTQLERLMKRNNLSKEDALSRINSQMDIKIKIAKADYTIDNSGDFENIKIKINEILKGLKAYENK